MSSEDSCACLGGSGLRLLTPPGNPGNPRDPGNPGDPGMSSGRAPMTLKTQYTGPFFPENEPHIFMEIQKSIFGPEKIARKAFCWTRKKHVGPEKISLDQKNMF